MSDYITTYTGEHFYPLEPEEDKIKIEDIAHALSLLCRGNGHVSRFFSVGQHCIHCALEAEARGYGSDIALACLLHDAGEAYLSDVPRPFKKSLPSYQKLEEQVLSIVYKKFLGRDLNEEEQRLVREIDDDMLYFDLSVLLNEQQNRKRPEMKSGFSYAFVSFQEVENRYLELYSKFVKSIDGK